MCLLQATFEDYPADKRFYFEAKSRQQFLDVLLLLGAPPILRQKIFRESATIHGPSSLHVSAEVPALIEFQYKDGIIKLEGFIIKHNKHGAFIPKKYIVACFCVFAPIIGILKHLNFMQNSFFPIIL